MVTFLLPIRNYYNLAIAILHSLAPLRAGHYVRLLRLEASFCQLVKSYTLWLYFREGYLPYNCFPVTFTLVEPTIKFKKLRYYPQPGSVV